MPEIYDIAINKKFVCIKIDEVSLAPSLQFQGEQVMAYAENSKEFVSIKRNFL